MLAPVAQAVNQGLRCAVQVGVVKGVVTTGDGSGGCDLVGMTCATYWMELAAAIRVTIRTIEETISKCEASQVIAPTD